MYEYKWSALNHLNQQQKGYLIARNKSLAIEILKQKNLFKIKLSKNIRFKQKLLLQQKYELIWQLSILLKSSIPLAESLFILLDNCNNKLIYIWLTDVLEKLEQGFSFSTSIEHRLNIFQAEDIALIKIAELTGELVNLLDRIIENKAKLLEIKRSVLQVMMYPSIILEIVLLLLIGLLLLIVPQFSLIYEDNQQALPSATKMLILLSKFMQNHALKILIIIIISYLIFKKIRQQVKWFNRLSYKLIINLPIFKNIIKISQLVELCRSLYLMLQVGVDLQKALTILVEEQRDEFKKILMVTLQGVNKGFNFSECLNSEIFPREIQQMLFIGERSGNIKPILLQIAENYEIVLKQKIILLNKLIEPIIMLIIGLLVSFILYALYSPIFNLGMIY